jgi:pyruvate,water dikinase
MPYGRTLYDFDEERDGKACWYSTAQWATPLFRPLYLEFYEVIMCQGMKSAFQDIVHWATCRGWNIRNLNGMTYLSGIVVTDEEAKEREPLFREKMTPVIDDPIGFWEGYKAQLKQIYDDHIGLDVENASEIKLGYYFYDCWLASGKMQEIHIALAGIYMAMISFFQNICADLAGIVPSDPRFGKLMSGFDTMLFRANKGLADLAALAIDLGLKNLFDATKAEEVLSTLEETDAGRKWLQKFQAYLEVYGTRGARMQDFTTTWLEKPSLAIPDITRMMTVGGVHAPDVVRENLAKEREETAKGVLSLVPFEQRDWFEKLMRAAQASNFWIEDHAVYGDYYSYYLARQAALALGKKYANRGVFDDPEDIFFLHHNEVIFPSEQVEQIRPDLHPLVASRKAEWEALKKVEHPIFIGDMNHLQELLVKDPMLAIGAAMPIAKPEEVGADVVGATGAAGVVEGIARVIMSYDDLGQLQPGEILVTPFTAVPWTPSFTIIKGLVTDIGGNACHSTIVAREFGIPAVTGTQIGTQKIKTGDKIRVDGNLLRVYILERA